MLLKAKPLRLDAKKRVVILNMDDAAELDVKPMDRVELRVNGKRENAIVNVAEKAVAKGWIGIYSRVQEELGVFSGQQIKVDPSDPPASLIFIKKRLNGTPLSRHEIMQIVRDVVNERLSEIELTSFVMSLYNHRMSINEAADLSMAMAATGKSLDLGKKRIYDKHSIGGVPGDKTSMMLVPIVAAAGLTIPKTSSRAITAPAGTADRMECLCPVDLGLEEIKRVVSRTNGCLVWGGAVDLSPADDAFIRVEYPLSIDPLLLPSVMSKKKAVGAKYVVIDIPTGRGVKVKTVSEAEELANSFIELGKKLGMEVSCVSTFGEQPVGRGVGPALEAREVLNSMMSPNRAPQDLVEKVARLSGELFEFAGMKNPDSIAAEMLRTGKAERKLRQIMEAQGGDPDIGPEDIPVGSRKVTIRSAKPGRVWWINNTAVIEVARAAGAPKDKGAGILFHKKIGDAVRKGDVLFEVYADKAHKMNRALESKDKLSFMGIGKSMEMVIKEIPGDEEQDNYFVLER